MRELSEETGMRISPNVVVGPIASRRVVHGFSDVIVDQIEVFFGVRSPRFTPDSGGHTDEELACIVGHQWFDRPSLAALVEPVWPGNLESIWDHWDAMERDPGVNPLELETTQESIVEVKP